MLRFRQLLQLLRGRHGSAGPQTAAAPGPRPGAVRHNPLPEFLLAASDEPVVGGFRIPAITAAELLEGIRPIRNTLADAAGLDDKSCAVYLDPLIERYVQQVHLLPASESHHHSRLGGLLVHGLEAAITASTTVHRTVLDYTEYYITHQDKRYKRKRAWVLAAITGALLHDLSKVLTDMRVWAPRPGSDLTGHPVDLELALSVWDPYGETMHEWIGTHAVRDYAISFVPGRQGEHEGLGVMFADRLVQGQLRELLGGENRDIFRDLIDSMGGGKGRISTIVKEADRRSVAEDRDRSRRVWAQRQQTGHPIVQRFLDGLNGLAEQTWKANEPDQGIWVANEGVFLVWPMTWNAVYEWSRRQGRADELAVPAQMALDHLLDAGICIRNPNTKSPLWAVEYQMIRGAPQTVTQCVLVANASSAFRQSLGVDPLPMKIFTPPDPKRRELIPTEPADAATSAATSQPPSPSAQAVPAPGTAPAPTASRAQQDDSSIGSDTSVPEARARRAPPQQPTEGPPTAEQPAAPPEAPPQGAAGEREQAPGTKSGSRKGRGERTKAKDAPSPDEALAKLAKLPNAGAVLRGIAETLRMRDDGGASMLVEMPSGGIGLRWPDVLDGTGHSERLVREQLAKGGASIMPTGPALLTTTTGNASDGPVKVLHLSALVARMLRQALSIDTEDRAARDLRRAFATWFRATYDPDKWFHTAVDDAVTAFCDAHPVMGRDAVMAAIGLEPDSIESGRFGGWIAQP